MVNNFTSTEASAPTVPGEADLQDIRARFIRATKRYDLIANGDLVSNVDNGADDWINAGQRFLDWKVFHRRQLRRNFEALTVDDFFIKIERSIAIERVTVIDSTDGRTDITTGYLEPAEFWISHSKLVSDWDSGKPTTWTNHRLALSPEQRAATSDSLDALGVVGHDDIDFSHTFLEEGIAFFPKADAVYTIEIVARFESETLSDDTDFSYWTVRFPDLLVLASAYCLDRTMSNTAKQRAWIEAMQPMLDEIDKAEVQIDMYNMQRRLEI